MAKKVTVDTSPKKVKSQMEKEKRAFEKAALPLIKYIAKNWHPHTTAIVNSSVAELVEGVMVLNTKNIHVPD